MENQIKENELLFRTYTADDNMLFDDSFKDFLEIPSRKKEKESLVSFTCEKGVTVRPHVTDSIPTVVFYFGK